MRVLVISDIHANLAAFEAVLADAANKWDTIWFLGDLIGYGPDPNNKYVTTYFRKTFNVSGAADIRLLNLEVVRDDGVIVYLNGTEVFRDGLPDGPVTFDTLANITVSNTRDDLLLYLNLEGAFTEEIKTVIASGVRPAYLWREYQQALSGRLTPACAPGCARCGVCP